MTYTELRTRRISWRVCAALVPHTLLRSGGIGGYPILLVLTFFAGIFMIPLGILLLGGKGILLGIAITFAIPITYVYVMISGGMWWATGAGLPTLAVRDGLVFGRIRPVSPGELNSGGPDDPDWWDFRAPANQLLGVRLVRGDRPSKYHVLAIDLPTDELTALRNSLREHGLPNTADRAESIAKTPAAWGIGSMHSFGRRSSAIRGILAALHEAGAPEAIRKA